MAGSQLTKRETRNGSLVLTPVAVDSEPEQIDAATPKVNLTATAAPTTGNDSTEGYEAGSRWLDTTSGDEYVCISAAEGAAVWKKTTASASDVKWDITVSCVRDEYPYYEWDGTFYRVIRAFAFRGTTAYGKSPTALKFVVQAGESGGAGYVEIYDMTNGQVIGRAGPISSQSIEIATVSSLSNLPTGEAVFQVRVKDSNGKKFRVYSASVVF